MANKSKKRNSKDGQVETKSQKSPFAPSSINEFYHEVVAEFKKIVWPDRKVTLGLSGFVILLTVVLSIYLGTVDFVLGKMVGMVLQ